MILFIMVNMEWKIIFTIAMLLISSFLFLISHKYC